MSETGKKHLTILVKGRVQGVGFRYAAKTVAQSIGVKGFAKNLTNGDVYIEAEGTEFQLNQYIKWCYQGPSYANVSDVIIDEENLKGFKFFDIVL